MNKGMFSRLLPHLIAIVIFLIVAVVYCKPVLEGKVLQQHDVTQWKAMAQNSFQYKETHGRFPLWTNGMFSGMPAYQIAMESEYKVSPGIFYYVLTLGLPKPISFFFLACICFYFLSQVLRINPYIGIIGSLAYAYATYNVVIIGAGHDTKMQSIDLMPFLSFVIFLINWNESSTDCILYFPYSSLYDHWIHCSLDKTKANKAHDRCRCYCSCSGVGRCVKQCSCSFNHL
jgi:hypothetical protein